MSNGTSNRLHDLITDLQAAYQQRFDVARLEQELQSATWKLERAQEIIKQAEKAGMTGPYGDDPGCPWCEARYDHKHRADCAAFGTEGVAQ
jgi:hypothetical protein